MMRNNEISNNYDTENILTEDILTDDIPSDDKEIITIEEDTCNERLDKYLSLIYPELSRSFIQGLIKDGNVFVNEKTAKASLKLKTGDILSVYIPEPEELGVEPEDIPLDIVYEDADIIIVNKPQGMVVHPANGHFTGTLVNALLYHCKDLSGVNGVMRPGIVHRIDMDTSGLLVVCKNDNAHKALSEQFSVHSITRVYTAICHGTIAEGTEGPVDKPIGRSKKDRKKMAIDPGGRRAVTHYKAVRKLKDDFTLIECRLETGRTHQIRVHMASLNHPILGDPVYGPKKCPYNLKGQLLHAGTLGFIHPSTGEYMEFHSEHPEHFKKILNILS